MKLAFVAKGGSGKSTVTSLFVRFLEESSKKYLCVDADINMHMMDILGINLAREKGLSFGSNVSDIKDYLRGSNSRIQKASQIVKTTPPSSGSGLLYINSENALIKSYAEKIQDNGFLMHVGTYEESGIGESCYHSNLSIFEALTSHTITDENHIFVADMTAGTDTFAGALHAQFDLVCLVVEPTKESVGLAQDFLHLAKKGDVLQYVAILANKIEDESDLEYIKEQLQMPIITQIPLLRELKTLRREGGSIFELDTNVFNSIDFESVFNKAKSNMNSVDDRLKLLHKLHERHARADYIVNRHGDISNQIDPTFSYSDFKYKYE